MRWRGWLGLLSCEQPTLEDNPLEPAGTGRGPVLRTTCRPADRPTRFRARLFLSTTSPRNVALARSGFPRLRRRLRSMAWRKGPFFRPGAGARAAEGKACGQERGCAEGRRPFPRGPRAEGLIRSGWPRAPNKPAGPCSDPILNIGRRNLDQPSVVPGADGSAPAEAGKQFQKIQRKRTLRTGRFGDLPIWSPPDERPHWRCGLTSLAWL